MPLTKAPSGCADMTREELEQLVSDLRRENSRLKNVVAKRERRANARDTDRNYILRIDGRPLRAARLAVGWTMQELADAIGIVSGNTISHYELGVSRMPEHHARSIVKVFVDASLAPPAFVFASHPKATKKPARSR